MTLEWGNYTWETRDKYTIKVRFLDFKVANMKKAVF